MFFGHWKYIEGDGQAGGGGRGWRGILLYSDQSSRMISTFPSTTMPRELYAIRQVGTGGSKIWTKRLERWSRGEGEGVSEKLFKCFK